MSTSQQVTAPIADEGPGAADDIVRPDLEPGQIPSFAAAFEQACRRWPGLVAVDDGTRQLTYEELDGRSTAVAQALQAAVPERSAVAVVTETTVEAVVAPAGVLRSGRPLVGLDKAMPAPRLRVIVQLSGATVLVSDEANLELAREVAGAGVAVESLTALEAAAPANPLLPVEPAALAAILFTSGSTGQPKGVMWSQRVTAAEAVPTGLSTGYPPGSRIAMSFPVSFAAGLASAAAALLRGATLLMADPRGLGSTGFLGWLRERQATALYATPSMMRGLLRMLGPDEVLEGLRLVALAGEPVQPSDIASVRRHVPSDAVFLQWLGSSEGGSLAFRVFTPSDPVPDGVVPFERPSPWRRYSIRSDDGEELPDGEAGNVVITSELMASGYWGDPERTAEKFVRRDDGLFDLHTGDLGVLGEDGSLRLMGRSEAAVKIRGYLVDPSEVEAALLASGRVQETVVMPTTEDGITRLVAYFVPSLGSSAANVAGLRSQLLTRLPVWMVPTHFVPLREIPKNERGKVDRQALPPVPPRRVELPTSTLEQQLAVIWADVLAIEEVGRGDDFLDLGGDSLQAEEMLARVEKSLGVKLLTSDFTQATVLADFARRIEGGIPLVAAPRWPGTEIELRRGTSGRTVFCVAGGGESSIAFVPLLGHLDPRDSVVVLQQRGLERRAPAEWTIEGMVRRRLAAIRRRQPTGPYLIVGHSFGAVLALELARRLHADGEQVVPFLIDPYFTESAAGAERRQPLIDLLVGGKPECLYWRLRRPAEAGIRLGMTALTGLLPTAFATRQMLPFRQSGLVMRGHRPQPWAGRVYGYRSSENADPAELWRRLAPNAVVRDLPGTHLSILQTPYIETVAADIAAEALVGSPA